MTSPVSTKKTTHIQTPKKTQQQISRYYQQKQPHHTQQQRQSTPKKLSVDTRLLVKVPPGHSSLSISPYSTMIQLNSFLKEKLAREVQIIKARFAICPTSPAIQQALISRTSVLESFLSTKGDC
ncbi:hypothetical protein EPUL_005548 [Erysiphe pulchra]|uniref:Uncharacterized protein n=1 Tax=Erysiphe pulchra TaxID=225359 RepID=A0A2S4PSD9_9PEZI|nr:hypothetical protein EPUL_005548 [Erysiphe pulchra]